MHTFDAGHDFQKEGGKNPMKHSSLYLVLLNLFTQVVSASGDEPDWAGDWSPGRKTGVSYLHWEGWQVQHVLLCESMGASSFLLPHSVGKFPVLKVPVWSQCVASSITSGVTVWSMRRMSFQPTHVCQMVYHSPQVLPQSQRCFFEGYFLFKISFFLNALSFSSFCKNAEFIEKFNQTEEEDVF